MHFFFFLVIQENETECVMMLDELFLAFQIIFLHHKQFHDLKFSLLKIAWRINEWWMCY